jgi:hypothetical protein
MVLLVSSQSRMTHLCHSTINFAVMQCGNVAEEGSP